MEAWIHTVQKTRNCASHVTYIKPIVLWELLEIQNAFFVCVEVSAWLPVCVCEKARELEEDQGRC